MNEIFYKKGDIVLSRHLGDIYCVVDREKNNCLIVTCLYGELPPAKAGGFLL